MSPGRYKKPANDRERDAPQEFKRLMGRYSVAEYRNSHYFESRHLPTVLFSPLEKLSTSSDHPGGVIYNYECNYF